MAHCYILHSPLLDRFYTGACQGDLIERINKHNTAAYGSHRFTTITNDWTLFLSFDDIDMPHAIRVERKIKSMKSKKYIANLKKYPELRQKILTETLVD